MFSTVKLKRYKLKVIGSGTAEYWEEPENEPIPVKKREDTKSYLPF